MRRPATTIWRTRACQAPHYLRTSGQPVRTAGSGIEHAAVMFANGTVGHGGPYDGIVTLNSAIPFQFTRPADPATSTRSVSIEHEIDEAIGLGSRLGGHGNDLRPQDLFSWSSPGHRNISTSGPRYFSINGGRDQHREFQSESGRRSRRLAERAMPSDASIRAKCFWLCRTVFRHLGDIA